MVDLIFLSVSEEKTIDRHNISKHLKCAFYARPSKWMEVIHLGRNASFKILCTFRAFRGCQNGH